MTRRARVLAITAVLATLLLTTGPQAHAADTVELVAAIDGRPVSESTESRPIRLDPKRPAALRLQVRNTGTAPVTIRTVRLRGEVMALTFFAYDTSVEIEVAPGATETRSFDVDLIGLRTQATGLIQGEVSVLDGGRHTLASQMVMVDVRGSMWSVYGGFGMALVVLTAISLGGALIALATHRLPDNRWRRGLRFLTPGLGIGLIIVFTLSALRVFVPRPGVWIPILLVSGGALFALGYLTPAPDDEDDDEDDALDDADADLEDDDVATATDPV
jgi:hypothetical protein